MRYLAGYGSGVAFGVHINNSLNMARGIVERVFYVVRDGRLTLPPRPAKGAFSRLSGVRQRLIRRTYPTPVVAQDDYPALYTGRKRAVYERARDSLTTRPVHPRDAWVSTFVKAEKINLDKKPDPAPRVIQPSSPRYNLALGCYLKPFEKEMCRAFAREFGYDVIVKGFNADKVGDIIATHWGSFNDPVAVGLDASRFDQHVSIDALRFEHGYYNAVFRSPELKRLLGWQLRPVGIGRTTDGKVIRYETEGCRISGVINTGMGNCFIMSCCVLAYFDHAGLTARLVNNGDDCVVICERSDLRRLDNIDQWFLELGFTLTREPVVDVLEKVEFCQCQPVHLATGWRMVRNPFTAMSKDCVALVSWDTPVAFGYWAQAISSCGLSLTSGVPVWEAWYTGLSRLAGAASEGVGELVRDSGLGYMARGVAECVVDDRARVSFWRAFGITPDQQVALEHEYLEPMSLADPTPMTASPNATALDIQNNPIALWRATHAARARP
nr:MAG: RNA-dependent RNA polymerase [Sanya tombus-like virus 5]